MSKRTGISEAVGGLIGEALGWAFCMVLLAGAYFIGFYLADWFGGGEHRDSFGLLSALTLVWVYERRQAEERWSRLVERQARGNVG